MYKTSDFVQNWGVNSVFEKIERNKNESRRDEDTMKERGVVKRIAIIKKINRKKLLMKNAQHSVTKKSPQKTSV